MIGSILLVILLVALVGFIAHLITTHIPMPDVFKQLIIVICVVMIVLYIIGLVMGTITLPTLKQLVQKGRPSMPMFDYRCKKCKKTRTDVFMHRAGAVITCPSGKDHGPMEKMACGPSFVVKGYNSKNGYGGYGQHRKEVKTKVKGVRSYVESF